MKKILFVGDINVDLIFSGLQGSIQPDREILCDEFSRTMGSSAAITSVAFSRLGGQAGFCGLAGDDDSGHYMLEGLSIRGVDTSLVDISPDIPTGVTLNLIEGRMRSQVTFPGTIARFDGSVLTIKSLEDWDHLHFTGVYQQDDFRPHLLHVLELCRSLSITTSMDTQWDSSEKWEGLEQWLPLIDYLFVNKDEALSIAGTEEVGKALTVLHKVVKEVVIKTGPEGSVGAESSRLFAVKSPDVTVKDTTGAGDTFAAAFLKKRIIDENSFYNSMLYASAAAAFSCSYSGGISDALIDAEVSALMPME